MSNFRRSLYVASPWQRWEMERFDVPSDEVVAAPEVEPQEIDMAGLLEEVKSLRALAQKQGHEEGYAAGFEQGKKAGLEQGLLAGQEEGFAKGQEKGYSEGYASGHELAQHELKQLAALHQQSQLALQKLHEDVGQALLALAVDIAEHVLSTELKSHPEQLLPIVQNTLTLCEQEQQALTLHINPADYELLHPYLTDEYAHLSWRLKADPSISAGGLQITSPLGVVDASLESRWRRAIARLGPIASTSS